MLQVVAVEIGVHVDALLPQDLVVLGAGEGGQDVELKQIKRQLALDDGDVAADRLLRIAGKPRM
jgi:hypothetical protein